MRGVELGLGRLTNQESNQYQAKMKAQRRNAALMSYRTAKSHNYWMHADVRLQKIYLLTSSQDKDST